MSLSTRIALGVATVLAATLLILGAAMVRATVTTLTAEIDDRLITAVDRAAHVPGPWMVGPEGGPQSWTRSAFRVQPQVPTSSCWMARRCQTSCLAMSR